LKKEQAELTRLNHAIVQLQTARPHLSAQIRYLAVDGWYAKQSYVDTARALDLAVVIKLRHDANMRFRFTRLRMGQRSRPKTYDGKINWQALRPFDQVETAPLDRAPGVAVFTAELYHGSLKRWLRVVVLV
jgi:hypothetical protein